MNYNSIIYSARLAGSYCDDNNLITIDKKKKIVYKNKNGEVRNTSTIVWYYCGDNYPINY